MEGYLYISNLGLYVFVMFINKVLRMPYISFSLEYVAEIFAINIMMYIYPKFVYMSFENCSK